jgi:hypothetical protein
MLGDPKNNPEATEDPYKTLFVGRLAYDVSESKLKRCAVVACTAYSTNPPPHTPTQAPTHSVTGRSVLGCVVTKGEVLAGSLY